MDCQFAGICYNIYIAILMVCGVGKFLQVPSSAVRKGNLGNDGVSFFIFTI